MKVVLEGMLDMRRWGDLMGKDGVLSLAPNGRPVLSELRDALRKAADLQAARIHIEAEGAVPKTVSGTWAADYSSSWDCLSVVQGFIRREYCRIGDKDVGAYLQELQRRKPGRRVRITVESAG